MIEERDIEALIADELRTVEETYHLDLLQVCCGDELIPTATVRVIAPGGKEIFDGYGHRPGGRRLQGNRTIVGVPNKLLEFSGKSITAGIDAIGEVSVRHSGGRSHLRRPWRRRCIIVAVAIGV